MYTYTEQKTCSESKDPVAAALEAPSAAQLAAAGGGDPHTGLQRKPTLVPI